MAREYDTTLIAREHRVLTGSGQVIATAVSPGWAARLAVAYNTSRRRPPDPSGGLGKRQRRLLADMAMEGQGRWPQRWRLTNDHRTVLTSLHRRGLVTTANIDAELTELAWGLQG